MCTHKERFGTRELRDFMENLNRGLIDQIN